MTSQPLKMGRHIVGLTVLLGIGLSAAGYQSVASGRFVKSADGLTVHDNVLHVTWLADANAPAKQKFGLAFRDSGAMTYRVARSWVAALNRGAGYLGRNDWTLPASPTTDSTCSVARGPNGNSFGFNCANSAMGSLYYQGLGFRQPNTVVPIPRGTVGPFRNFQPYLYWSLTGKDRDGDDPRQTRRERRENGSHAFSFNTGWQGGNVSDHVMYVLPMIAGRLPGTPPANDKALHPSADGQTVYDPVSNVTWLANANLAAEMQFGVAGIVADGAMARATAGAFIEAMNRYNGKGYLGHANWQLPPTNPDPSCSNRDGGYDCTGSPMGALYHHHLLPLLRVESGNPVVKAPDLAVGPFHNIQPYLYWSCAGGQSQTICGSAPAAPGFEWSFSFGNGFQGTDVIGNSLYVMVYAPDPQSRR